jgi:type IV pilus assembly protein PilW
MRNPQATLHSSRSQRGVSLVELMIAITLGLMVLATLASVFANSSRSRTELDRVSRQIENGRYAMEILTDDLRLAGFYGEFPVNATTQQAALPAALPDPCKGVPNQAVWQQAMLVSVQAYDNGNGIPGCVPGLDLKPGTDVVVVRRVSTCEAGVAGCAVAVPNRPYIQVSKCSAPPLQETATLASLYVLDYGTGNPPFKLHAHNCVDPAPMRQYIVNIYYISVNNGQGQAIPTLTRLEFDGVQFAIVPLVEGIEELNVEWGIDNNNDGAPDIYTADPSAYSYGGCTTCSAPENWTRVVTAKITLLARNTEASNNYTDQKTYTLGNDAANIPITKTYNDAYRRHVYTSTVRLVNVADRRDVP